MRFNHYLEKIVRLQDMIREAKFRGDYEEVERLKEELKKVNMEYRRALEEYASAKALQQ